MRAPPALSVSCAPVNRSPSAVLVLSEQHNVARHSAASCYSPLNEEPARQLARYPYQFAGPLVSTLFSLSPIACELHSYAASKARAACSSATQANSPQATSRSSSGPLFYSSSLFCFALCLCAAAAARQRPHLRVREFARSFLSASPLAGDCVLLPVVPAMSCGLCSA